jgi:hypothetical protein
MTLQTHTYTGGRNRLVADLVADRSHKVEAWGNAREGFAPYLVDRDDVGGLSIGQRYRTLSGLRLDVARAYGQGLKVRVGRAW